MEHAAHELTPRQQEVLQLAAYGKRSAAIAVELGISIETVKTHLQNTFVQLNAANRCEAVAIALRAGVIA